MKNQKNNMAILQKKRQNNNRIQIDRNIFSQYRIAVPLQLRILFLEIIKLSVWVENLPMNKYFKLELK